MEIFETCLTYGGPRACPHAPILLGREASLTAAFGDIANTLLCRARARLAEPLPPYTPRQYLAGAARPAGLPGQHLPRPMTAARRVFNILEHTNRCLLGNQHGPHRSIQRSG
jgi:hypothetical protein